jgi:hypothetical protein
VRARARDLAGWVVLGEGVALTLLCVGYAVSLVVGHPHNRGLALVGALFGLLCGLALLLAGRGLRQGARWPWSPAFLAQLFMLPVGIGLVQGGQGVYGVLVLAPAIAAGALLVLAPPRPVEAD